MFDSFGDGWSGSEYYIYSLETGALEDSGSLGTAFTGDGLTVGTDYVCLAPGCYNFQVLNDTWPGEVSIDLSDQFGTSYATVGAASDYGLDFTLTGQCGFEDALTQLVSTTILLRPWTMEHVDTPIQRRSCGC